MLAFKNYPRTPKQKKNRTMARVDGLPDHEPSLCIPRVFKNLSRQFILDRLKEVNLGTVHRLDIVKVQSNQKGKDSYQRVFVHLTWNTASAESQEARRQVLDGRDIQIIYEDPWYWKVSANRQRIPRRPQEVVPSVVVRDEIHFEQAHDGDGDVNMEKKEEPESRWPKKERHEPLDEDDDDTIPSVYPAYWLPPSSPALLPLFPPHRGHFVFRPIFETSVSLYNPNQPLFFPGPVRIEPPEPEEEDQDDRTEEPPPYSSVSPRLSFIPVKKEELEG